MQYFTKDVPSQALVDVYGKATLTTLKRYQDLLAKFKKAFRKDGCFFVSSPGRVELIGNHVDHNGGEVIGTAINLDMVCAFAPNDKGTVKILNSRQNISFRLEAVDKLALGSLGMTKGVISYLKSQGYKIGGFDAVLDSIIPIGSGLSSSAAFQLVTATIINYLYNDGKIPTEVLAYAGQYAENVFFGKPCGLLDQGVVAEGGIVSIDFKDGFTCRHFDPRVLDDISLILVNTGKSHSALTRNYAQIPKDMYDVAEYFHKSRLIDVNYNEFLSNVQPLINQLGTLPVLRADHFFEECRRVKEAEKALIARDTDTFLDLIYQSGQSSIHKLQNCTANGNTVLLDAIEYVQQHCPDSAVRVHGGGFAGTILVVTKTENKAKTLGILVNRFLQSNVICVTPRKGATVL